ncbi:MAG: preprotein translocase [Thiomonas sp. 20-64-9]|nr:MAG: preprotein translocase [Thiomonas sp. 20-64-9]
MGKRENFTAARVAEFACPADKQQAIFKDGKQPGLGLRVTAKNARAYIFESKCQGRTVRVTIGSPDTWTIDAARKEAARLKVLTDQGINPAEQRREQDEAKQRAKAERAAIAMQSEAEAQRQQLLVADAWDAYLTHHERRWGARHMRDHVTLAQPGGVTKKRGPGVTVAGVLRPVLDMRMSEITADVLAAWVLREAETRANNARQGYELFRAFWRWCAERPEYDGIMDARPVESRDMRADVPSRKSKRFDVLERAHLAPWFAAVRSIKNPVIAAYLQGLLLTGARREELAELKWADVDFSLGAMWLKDKVRPEGRKVPLTPYLASLVQALPRRNKWVFSSPTAKDGKLTEPRIAHVRALEGAGLPHVSLHGLRRTFASLAEWVELPAGVVAQIMGHAPNATAERHYINRPLELLAVWHGKYEAWILEQAGIEFQAVQAMPTLRRVQ